MKTKARRGQGHPITPETQQLSSYLPGGPHSPLGDILGRLQEPRVVILLQRVLRLRDEGCRALDALFAVGNLLGQLAEPHHLGEKHGEGYTSLLVQ